jgi:hypothetical protein
MMAQSWLDIRTLMQWLQDRRQKRQSSALDTKCLQWEGRPTAPSTRYRLILHYIDQLRGGAHDLPIEERIDLLKKFYLRVMVEDPIDGTALDCAILDALDGVLKLEKTRANQASDNSA